MLTSLIPSFNAGELSPLIHLRSDLDKYRSGCRTLENMLITPYGGVKRRPGLAYTATCPGRCRLFSFQASLQQGYILEVSAGMIRFYSRDSLVQAGGGGNYSVVNPYADEDLAELKVAQINSIAYFVHPDFPPYKLTRFANADWTFEPVDWSHPAMLNENLDKTLELTVTPAGEVDDVVDITASWDAFTTLDVGSYYQINQERAADKFEVKLTASSGNNGAYSDTLVVQGDWDFRTQGTWDGTFELYRSSDGGSNWDLIGSYNSEDDSNYSVGRSESSRVLMRIKWIHVGATGSTKPLAALEVSDPFIRGVVRIDAVTSPTSATATAIKPVEAGTTSYWRQGAWSDRNGYPRTVAAHEQRIIYGGTANDPQTLWASAVDDYENFEPGVEDSDSWSHTLVSGSQNAIQWIMSSKSLLVGTSGDEWAVSSDKQEAIITPTNVRARRHSGNGSENVTPLLVDDSILFVQRGGRVVREMGYKFEADGYVTTDLTLLAEHITGNGIVETAWQTQTESTMWAITRDGTLLGLTYEKAQQITGWQRHLTGDSATDGFESVAVKRVEGEADQVWVVVRRTIDGTAVRYVERLKPDGFFLENPWSMLYLDQDGLDYWSMLYVEPTSEADWSGLYESFSATDVRYYALESGSTWVEDTDYLLYCLVDHTNTATDYSPTYGYLIGSITTEPWIVVPAYDVTGRSFSVGEYAYYANGIYECIQANARSDGQIPGAAPTYWTYIDSYSSTPDLWFQQSDFAEDDLVQNGGRTYTALSAHTPIPSREPGVGSSWQTYWSVNQDVYEVDDRIAVGFVTYICILEHTPGTASKPDTGASWETYWELEQGTYGIGDLVSSEGENYVCDVEHTPAAANRPGYGVDWADYWSLQLVADRPKFYVDSGVTLINPGAITEMTGLDHLEGETVQVVANGAVLPSREVSGGAIQFDQEGDPTTFTDVSAGLAYESILEPMALEVGMQNGTSVSREKRIHELVIYFHESYGCKVASTRTGDFDTMSFYDSDVIDPPVLFTGPKLHKMDSRHNLDASFVLKQDLPMPFHVTAVVPKFNVYGDSN